MKSILLLTITLQVVLCRPDVSHLSASGSLGKGKGYDYPPPPAGGNPFEDSSSSGFGEESEYPDVFASHSDLDPNSAKTAPAPEGPSAAEKDIFSEIFPPLTGAISPPFGGAPNVISSSISSSSSNGPNGQSSSIQSSISTGNFGPSAPAGAGIGGVDATYIAGNPGVTHNAQLKGHSASQKFINLFTRD